jgi:hypothetical protein
MENAMSETPHTQPAPETGGTSEPAPSSNNCQPDSPPQSSCASPPQDAGGDSDCQHGALISADIQADHGLQIDVDALGFNVADISVDLGGVDGSLSDLLC